MSDEAAVTITRQDKYRFLVDFGPGIAGTVVDEPAPLSDGSGPSPSQLLAAAVGSCLSASFLFASTKFKEDLGRLTTTAKCHTGRNENNRGSALRPGSPPACACWSRAGWCCR